MVLVGASSTAVEITGLRFLAPLFGSSLPVWGGAIATVLGGLAIGYSLGGKRTRYPISPGLVFQYAVVASLIFLCFPFAFQLASFLQTASLLDAPLLPNIAALVIAFCMLLAPSMVFGLISPLASQLETTFLNQTTGQASGKVFTLTTAGSLLGILIPSFITIPLLGSKETVWLFAISLIAISMVSLWWTKRSYVIVIFLTSSAMGLSLLHLSDQSNIIFAQETPLQYVTVRQVGDRRLLSFDGNLGIQSIYSPHPHVEAYWDYLAALPIFLPSQENLSVAVLGAAASSAERQLERFWSDQKNFFFTSVELDNYLFPIADTYFDPPPRQKITSDARVFVGSSQSTYDLVILDTYTRETTVPFHLATVEFFHQIKQRLTSQGVLVINVNAISRDSLWIRSLSKTVSQAFPHVRLASLPNSCNHLLIASAHPWQQHLPNQKVPPLVAPLVPILAHAQPPLSDGVLLTDNRAPTDLLGLLALTWNPKGLGCGASA